jgi:hypothetical protein
MKTNENPRWLDDSIQFPRLISELQMAGAFTDKILMDLKDSMDLTTAEIFELVDRADKTWQTQKLKTKGELK